MKNLDNPLLLGCHVNMKGPLYLLGSVNQAIDYGANCFMIYTGPNQSTQRTEINQLKIKEFHQVLQNHHIPIENVIVHAPYILNLASGDTKKRSFSIDFLEKELNRTQAVGSKYFVLHPGNAINVDRQTGLDNIARAINQIYSHNPLNVTICLETMAGKGKELGINFQEIATMISQIKDISHIGVCLDTCHIHDAGYDLKHFDQILEEFDRVIGLKYLKVVHINDSMNQMASHKDRHENIGYGSIGFDLLCQIVHHTKLTKIPKILETPWYKNQPLYKYEIEMLQSKKWFDIKKQINE